MGSVYRHKQQQGRRLHQTQTGILPCTWLPEKSLQSWTTVTTGCIWGWGVLLNLEMRHLTQWFTRSLGGREGGFRSSGRPEFWIQIYSIWSVIILNQLLITIIADFYFDNSQISIIITNYINNLNNSNKPQNGPSANHQKAYSTYIFPWICLKLSESM